MLRTKLLGTVGAWLAAFVVLPASTALASDSSIKRTFAITNDALVRSDHGYTGGFRYTWVVAGNRDETMSADGAERIAQEIVSRAQFLPPMDRPEYRHEVSWTIGHDIFTPDNLKAEELIVDDVPYSALLFGTLGLQAFDDSNAHAWALTLGMLGPSAQGEKLQKAMHKLTGAAQPRGWHNQLKNEPVINVAYERRIKSRPIRTSLFRRDWYYDLITHYGANLGSVETSVEGGAMLRISSSALNDFGTFVVRPGSQRPIIGATSVASQAPGFSLVAGIDMRWLGRTVFLDGSTWRSSHRVERQNYVHTFLIATEVRLRNLSLSLSLTIPRELAINSNDTDAYGTLAFSRHF